MAMTMERYGMGEAPLQIITFRDRHFPKSIFCTIMDQEQVLHLDEGGHIMAMIMEHYLKGEEPLQQLLENAGVLAEKTLHDPLGNAHTLLVLDLRACCPAEWESYQQQLTEQGVAYLDADGRVCKRPMTAQEVEELPYWPVEFLPEGELLWKSRNQIFEYPAYLISKRLPRLVLRLQIYCEADLMAEQEVRNGEFSDLDV